MKIAISGLSGSGNTTACEKVASGLGLKVINYTFKNLADELGMDFYEIHEKRKVDDAFDLLLDKRQIEMFESQNDAVLGSRLAIFISDANLRVWLDCPINVRSKRIAKREKMPLLDALERTKKRDAENFEQYKRLYGLNIMDHDFVDLVLDTEKMDADRIAKKIIEAAKSGKYAELKKSAYSKEIKKTIESKLNILKC